MTSVSLANGEALGLLEVRGEVAGLAALDKAAKGGGVKASFGQPVCPGKFLIFLTGSVASVQSSVSAGTAEPGLMYIDKLVIPAVHPDIWPALTGSTVPKSQDGFAILETYSATTILHVADQMAKSAAVHLLRIRLCSGLGGRGLLICTGDVSNLQAAITVGKSVAGYQLAAAQVVAAPHSRLWELVL